MPILPFMRFNDENVQFERKINKHIKCVGLNDNCLIKSMYLHYNKTAVYREIRETKTRATLTTVTTCR